MKRFAPLLLIVLALAAVPVAAADDSAPARPNARPGVQLQILRLQLQLVHLRYRVACHKQDSDRCAQVTQRIVDRLTRLDGNVQQRIDKHNCTADSTDKKCTVLTKLDTRLQSLLQKLSSAPAPSSDESALDGAAAALTP